MYGVVKVIRQCIICTKKFKIKNRGNRKTCSTRCSQKNLHDYQEAYRGRPENKAIHRAYMQTSDARAKQKTHRNLPEVKKYQKEYRLTPEMKEKQKFYRNTSKVRARKKAYDDDPKNKSRAKELQKIREYGFDL